MYNLEGVLGLSFLTLGFAVGSPTLALIGLFWVLDSAIRVSVMASAGAALTLTSTAVGASVGLSLGAALGIAAVCVAAGAYIGFGSCCLFYAADYAWKNNSTGTMGSLLDPRNYMEKDRPLMNLFKGMAFLPAAPFLLAGGLLGLGVKKAFDTMSSIFTKNKGNKFEVIINTALDNSIKMNNTLLTKNSQQKECKLEQNQNHYELPFSKTSSKKIKSEQAVTQCLTMR